MLMTLRKPLLEMPLMESLLQARGSPQVVMLKQVQTKILAQQVYSWLWPHLPIRNP